MSRSVRFWSMTTVAAIKPLPLLGSSSVTAWCSLPATRARAAIPASKVYEEAGIPTISSTASNPKLTDEGGPNIFRMAGRDDQIARVAGHWLADRWSDAQIAIFHDGTAYGKGLAEEVKGS